MFGKAKAFVVAAATVAALVPAGATAAEAGFEMAACQVKPLFSVIEYRQTVLIYGVYNAPAGAIDVQLTCGVTRYGATVARATDATAGPAAALASTATVAAGTIGSCHEIRVTYLDRTTYSDTCP